MTTRSERGVNWLTLGGRDYRLLFFDAGESNVTQWDESLRVLNLRGLEIDLSWLDPTGVTASLLSIIAHESSDRSWPKVNEDDLTNFCHWYNVKEFYLSPASGRHYLITYSFGPSKRLTGMHYIQEEVLLGLTFQYYPEPGQPVPRKSNWLREGF